MYVVKGENRANCLYHCYDLDVIVSAVRRDWLLSGSRHPATFAMFANIAKFATFHKTHSSRIRLKYSGHGVLA